MLLTEFQKQPSLGIGSLTPPDFGLGPVVQALTNDISGIRLTLGDDHYRCKLTGDGTYTVRSVRKVIDKPPITTTGTMTIQWYKVVPIKVLCFIWRAAQGRIPAIVALEMRGIKVNSLLCSACIGQQESVDHVLIDCPFASRIRSNIMSWCGVTLDQSLIRNAGDILQMFSIKLQMT
ncbi:unnamed protein product [Lactuca virosa]|uniref:Reverse transcriptase zinc-binding domain-containing protein n=1 Tax=Lactuca virosa TaxID=75947 RepID=A0AAU9NZP8_9ASTR|nr:unnamed protein product [Lactuca virosa]